MGRVNVVMPGGIPEPEDVPVTAPDEKKPAPRNKKESDNG